MDEQYFIIRNTGNQGPLSKRQVIQLILDKSVGPNHMVILDKEVPRKAIDFMVFREYFEQEIELEEIEEKRPEKKKQEPEFIVRGKKNRGETVNADGEVVKRPKKELDYEKLGLYALIGGAGIFFLVLIYIIISATGGKKQPPATHQAETPIERKEDPKPVERRDTTRKLPTLDDYK